MKKLLSIIIACLLIVSTLAACAKTQTDTNDKPTNQEQKQDDNKEDKQDTEQNQDEEKAPYVGLAIWSRGYTFYVNMYDAFVEECESRGWEYVITDGNDDLQTQINQCYDILNRGVDALVIASHFGESLGEVYAAAEKADVPVFLIDTALPTEEGQECVAKTGTSYRDATRVTGLYMAKYFKDMGKNEINIVNITSGTNVGQDRTGGYMDGLKEGGITVNILAEPWAAQRADAMSMTEDVLMTYDDIDAIFTITGQGGLGAYDACQAAKRDPLIIAFDGEEEEMQLIDAGTQYIATTVQHPDLMAVNILEVIDRYLNGEEIGPNYEFPTETGVYVQGREYTQSEIEEMIKE